LIEPDPSYSRMVNRAFDKIRQAARGMPAVIIRLLDALAHVTENTSTSRQRAVLMRQAEMILRGAEEDVREPNDMTDILRRYERLEQISVAMNETSPLPLESDVGPIPADPVHLGGKKRRPPSGGPVYHS
jgi:uncharacterized membrane protein